jgi:hypothetical protein
MKTLAFLISYAFICQGMLGSTFENTNAFPDSDSGTFDYYVDGVKVGTSSYEFLLERVLSNTFEVAVDDASFKGEVKIEFSGQGNWEKVYYENNGNSVSMTNSGSEIEVSIGGGERSIPNESQGNLLEDMTPILLQPIIKKHAKRTSEIQHFKAYFIPALNIKGEIEYLGSSEKTIKKKSGKYHSYRVNVPPVYEMEIVTDTDSNICIIYYRAQNGAFVRPGFEELL